MSTFATTNGLTDHSDRKAQLRVMGKLATPLVIGGLLAFATNFINLVFAGTLEVAAGTDPNTIFAGIAMASTFANITTISVLVGLSSAISTTAGQLNGAEQYKEVGLVVQRGWLCLSAVSIPMMIVWIWAPGPLFSLIGLDEAVCTVIQTFLRIRVISLPVDVSMICYGQYLGAIQLMKPSMGAQILQNVLLVGLNFITLNLLRYSYEWIAWNTVFSNIAALVFVVYWSQSSQKVKRTLAGGWDWRAWDEWYAFYSMGMAGVLMDCAEWWAFEIVGIMAASMSTEDAATQGIVLQAINLAFMIPSSIGYATGSMVSNAIGAGQGLLARNVSKTAIGLVLAIDVVVVLLAVFFGREFAMLFTDNEELRDNVGVSLQYISPFMISDGFQSVLSNILRGAGKQTYGAIINIVAFLTIGLITAWFLGFFMEWELNGLLLGIVAGSVSQSTFLLYCFHQFSTEVYQPIVVTKPTDVHLEMTTYQAVTTTESV